MVNDDSFAGVVPFVRVVEEKSYRRAAERLGVSTAAVSKAVSRLERELGAQLLNRTSRHVSATPAGQLLFERCREAIAQVRAAREQIADAQAAVKGELRVTVPLVLRGALMPKLAAFLAEHPALTLRLLFTDRFVSLERDDVDVAVRIGTLERSRLLRKPLRSPRWLLCAAPGYLARKGRPQRPEELSRHECLKFVLPSGTLREWALRRTPGGKASVRVTPTVLKADDGHALLEAALAGVGLTQVFDFMVEEHLRSGALVEVLGDHAPPGPPMHALYLPERRSAPRVRAFLDFIERVMGRVR